jgi:hypothetical protein
VHVIKVSRPSTRATHAIQNPSVCIVTQGAKSVMIADDVYPYEGGQVAETDHSEGRAVSRRRRVAKERRVADA